MFKQITYTGFDSQPELRQAIEQAMPWIEEVLKMSHERISLTWRYRSEGLPIELTLTDDWAGSTIVELMPEELRNERQVKSVVRAAHMRLLDRFLNERIGRLKATLAEPAGV